MKKCTLCVDRIYDTELPAAERQPPTCVLAYPATRRGDYDDATSKVSQLAAARPAPGVALALAVARPTYLSPPRPVPR
ncbi:hypothetical protein [Casimicrobium huifangae]|uniref:hypothetical protein n=1 Tax=Casimicrobium huifangae TaxID=2591109 RepID=UPI003783DB49